METVQQTLIIEEQIITPLNEVLDQITPNPELKSAQREPSKSLTKSLDELFPEQQHEEKTIQRTREVLGELANNLTPEQLKDTIIEIQYLCESWLDDFERETFDGLTLKELLHEKGSL